MLAINKITADKNGFSLIEIVFTIIIIGLAMGAITESFIAGSAKSVNIVNEETAVNVAKQITAELNYCRNNEGAGSGTGGVAGVCNAFTAGTWSSPSSFYTSPQATTAPINNQCFYTAITAQQVNFTDNSGSGTIQGSSNNFIQAIVQTGWSAWSGVSCPAPPAGCPGTPGSCPWVTVSTVYANY